MQVLFSCCENLSIIGSTEMQVAIITEDFEILEKINMESFSMPSAQEFLKIVDKTARKYWGIGEDHKYIVVKNACEMAYERFMKSFKSSDFYKDYLKYDSEEE